MTLQELGKQYLAQEAVLRERLHELRLLAKVKEDPLLLRRIYYLTTSAAECRKTGLYLINYYNDKEKKTV